MGFLQQLFEDFPETIAAIKGLGHIIGRAPIPFEHAGREAGYAASKEGTAG